MTFQTEAHRERLLVANFIHLVHAPVAMDATDAAIYVHGVIEINVIGDFVDLDPVDGLAGRGAFANERQARIVGEHLIMAIHARAGAGNVRIPGFFNAIVAITAVDPELIGVDGVGKTDGLNRLVTDAGVFGREIIRHAERGDSPNE